MTLLLGNHLMRNPVWPLIPLFLSFAALGPATARSEGMPVPIADWQSDAPFVAASPDDQLTLNPSEGGWPAVGSLAFRFELEAPENTWRLAPEWQDGNLGGPFFQLPFVEARLWFTRQAGLNRNSGLNFYLQTADEPKLQQLSLTRLEGRKPYHMIFAWDIPNDRVGTYLQGTEQSDLGHWRASDLPMAGPGEGPGFLQGGLRAGNAAQVPISFRDVQLFDRFLTRDEAQRLTEPLALPPLAGEARTVYARGLDLSAIDLDLLYETDFAAADWDGTHENDLLDPTTGERRVLPDTEWVLEGPLATATPTPEGLRLEISDPTDRQDGHVVLWNTRPFPADFLFEYTFSPRNDRQGLGIVFFNAHNPNGETLFDLNLPARHGRFREYIMGTINSYHVSPWAADETTLRRTANLRKNSGFMLVAIGNDVIGGSGPGPHTVRILKRGGHIQVESNGKLALEYVDDGVSHGPIHDQAGLIGLRFMAHTGWAMVHSMKVYAITPSD